MDELIQTGTVVDMIVFKEGRSVGYARQMIFRAVKNDELKVYKRKLKFGSRSINLFDPVTVEKWLGSRRTYKSRKVTTTA